MNAGETLRDLEPLLDLQDLSKILKVPVKTLYQWSYKGQLPPTIKLGAGLRFRPSDVAVWLAEQAREAEVGP